jgi:hypothetical protein
LLRKPEKGDEKELDKRDKTKRLDKENLNEERASGHSYTLPRRSDVELKDEKPKRSVSSESRATNADAAVSWTCMELNYLSWRTQPAVTLRRLR